MFEFQLAPFIIAGLLVATGYLLNRWVDNLVQVRNWKATAQIGWRHNDELTEQIAGMQAEGCAALGALQNIFNGITAQGAPYSKTMRKVADTAADVLIDVPSCDHKAQAEDNEGRIEHAIIRAENWEKIADRLADEQIQTKKDIAEAEGRAVEAERLLGLVNDRLLVERSLGRIL